MEQILREIGEKEGFSDKVKVDICDSGLKDGSNFHGSIIRGTIWEEGRALPVFIKKEVPSKETNSREKFSNEIHFYTKIYPQLKTFGVTPKVPRYLWSSSDGDASILVLEDLATEGYSMPNLDRVLGPLEVQLALKELEKLHETSKKMKEQNSDLLDELALKLEESFCVGHIYEGVLAKCYENAIKCAATYLPPQYKERLECFDFPKASEWATKRNGPGMVFTHGDSWYSNFMFKYQGNTPTAAAIVDWQMCRIGSPLLDVSELLLSSTTGVPCPSAPECCFGLTVAITILPFSLGQADPKLVMTPEKLEFSENPTIMKRIADIVKRAVDSGII